MTDIQKAELQAEKLEGKVAVSTEVTPGPGEISWKQIGRGLIIAVISGVFPIIKSSFDAGTFAVNWVAVGTTAASTALGYILWALTQSTKQITIFKKP